MKPNVVRGNPRFFHAQLTDHSGGFTRTLADSPRPSGLRGIYEGQLGLQVALSGAQIGGVLF